MDIWESKAFDINLQGFSEQKITAGDVYNLVYSNSDAEALELYRKIDAVITKNGDVFSIAVPVVKILLALFQKCTDESRKYCLDLLTEVALGEPIDVPSQFHDECMRELQQGTWYFLYGLQFDDSELIRRYVDILFALGQYFPEIGKKITAYFEMSLSRAVIDEDKEYIQSAIDQFQST